MARVVFAVAGRCAVRRAAGACPAPVPAFRAWTLPVPADGAAAGAPDAAVLQHQLLPATSADAAVTAADDGREIRHRNTGLPVLACYRDDGGRCLSPVTAR